ncbi:MAG: serine--tRNA ligase [Actinomycetota bacterium]
MLSIKFVRENLDLVKKSLKDRSFEGKMLAHLDKLVELDKRRHSVLIEAEELKAAKNRASDQISQLKRQGKKVDKEINGVRELSHRIHGLDDALRATETAIRSILLDTPNVPHQSVPVGQDPSDNVEVRRFGKEPHFDFKPKPHWEIGEALGILDFERGTKIAGARFVLLKGMGALLERALISFMLDLHTKENGYTEIFPPLMVNTETMTGTGQLPKFAVELYKCKDDDLYLIPTAEVPVTNIHRDEILDGSMLPLKYVAYTPCFRREAGSYGKDIRGIIRQHQFNKVELVKFTRPEESYDELESLTADAEGVLQKLNLYHRVVILCTGDLGFSGAKTYDIEGWIPSSGGFKEISSCTNFEDYQARRINIRFRPEPKAKPEYVHTLNGSGVAIGRTVAAIIEQFQQKDGSVLIPEALRSYMGGLEKLSA